MFLSSCEYKYIVEPVIPPPPPGDTLSFSEQIEPIWGEQGCVSCHSTSGQKPDLTVGNAYGSITGMGLVNTGDPTSSRIYFYPLPDGSHYAKYTASQGSLILLWIEEGALDN